MEVYVECAECGSLLETHKVELRYNTDAVLKVLPCQDCIGSEARKLSE